MSRQLGLGVIGYGGFGEFTTAALKDLPQLRIAAIFDTIEARREAAASRYQRTRVYAEMEQLLSDPEVDIVTIATPPWLHVSQALAAIKAKKHVFLEKPLATILSDADTLVSAVHEHRVHLTIDYVLRHVPIYKKLQALVNSKLLGDVAYVRLENTASNEALHAQHWFWNRAKSGGIFIEHGVHFFDLCNQVVGSNPDIISGYAHTGSNGRQDRVMSAVAYANGVQANFYHTFDRPAIIEQTTFHVVMERGTATAYGWIPDRLEIQGTLPEQNYGQLEEVLGVRLEVTSVPAPEGITGATPGQLVHATLTRANRTLDYQNAVREGVADLIKAIQEPDYKPQVSLQDAYDSFKLAYLSQQSIEKGHSLNF